MPRRIDLTRQRFSRLVVLNPAHRDQSEGLHWRCRCDCGNEVTVGGPNLRKGMTRSCGCLLREIARTLCRERNLSHGMTGTPEHQVWCALFTRCENPRVASYKNYGGRGIKVRISFEDFYAEVGDRPPGMSIDRIDNDRDYEPGNIRWATAKQQRANQRRRANAAQSTL
jgi:hypothetical protein